MDKYSTLWIKSYDDELGRLSQGIQDIPVTDKIRLICFSAVPKVLTVTYGLIYVNYRPQK